MAMHTVGEIVANKPSNKLHSISPQASAELAAARMLSLEINSLLVIEDEKPVGILTSRDFMDFAATHPGTLISDTRVEQLMTRNIIRVNSDMTVNEARLIMKESHCRHLPVFEDDEPIGMVSLSDLTEAYAEALAEDAEWAHRMLVGETF